MSIHRISVLFLLIVLMFGGNACEKASQSERGQNIVLERKQQQLAEKKKSLLQLNLEIAQLQAEVEELDPSLGKNVQQTPVVASPIKTADFQHFIQVQGKVEADKNILVSPQMSGRLVNMYVSEGQNVRAGQLLAKLDASIMEASMAELQTALDLANIMFGKQENLWKQEIGTEVQFLTAKNQKESLEQKIKTLKEQLALQNVVAPISGIVDEILPKVGETVSPAMPAFRIVNNTNLSLNANLSESYAPYIKKGDVVKVNFPALDKSFDGKVSLIGQSIDANDRTFRVEVKLPNNPGFKPNMFGQLAINDQSREAAIVIPFGIVQHSEQGPFVFVADKSGDRWLAQRRMLKLGLSAGEKIEVVTGLSAGEMLITAGHNDLSDGQEILVQGTNGNSVVVK